MKYTFHDVTQCSSEHVLYHVENEVELGVCVCVSRFEHGWAYSSKKKGKEKILCHVASLKFD